MRTAKPSYVLAIAGIVTAGMVTAGMVTAAPSAAAADSYDAVVLTDAPEMYLTLDGTTQGLLDLTGHGHNAVNHGATRGAFITGGAASFAGAGQYIEVANHTALSVPATGVLTVEAWMAPSVKTFPDSEGSLADDYVHWMGKSTSGQSEWVARMYNEFPTGERERPNRISGYAFNLAGGLGAGSYFQDPISVNQWIHYVLVINTVDRTQYPAGHVRIYRDGVLRDTDSLLDYHIVPAHGAAPMRIGTASLNSFFQGRIARAAVYGHELTSERIVGHYRTLVPAPTSMAGAHGPGPERQSD